MMKNKIVAIILLIPNAVMILYALQLLYLYNFSDYVFAYKLPAWLLGVYLLIGVWGVFVDWKLYKAQKLIKTALLQDLLPKMALLAVELLLF